MIKCENGIMSGSYHVSWKTTNEDKDQVRVDAEIVLDGCPLTDMVKWAAKTRVIDRQKVERTMKAKDIPTKLKINIGEMGLGASSKKQPSMASILANVFIAQGMSQDKAIQKASELTKNPLKIAEALAKVGMI